MSLPRDNLPDGIWRCFRDTQQILSSYETFLLYNLQINFYNFEDHPCSLVSSHTTRLRSCGRVTSCLMYILRCLVSKYTIYYTGYLKTILFFLQYSQVTFVSVRCLSNEFIIGSIRILPCLQNEIRLFVREPFYRILSNGIRAFYAGLSFYTIFLASRITYFALLALLYYYKIWCHTIYIYIYIM